MLKSSSDELAELHARMKAAANRAGRVLHDDVGPLLSAAGLHLQLLRMDHPEIAAEIGQVGGILDQACERIRGVSQELAPSPVLRGGLKNALERLVEATAAGHPGIAIKLDYGATAGGVSIEAACAFYDAAAAVLAMAAGAPRTTRIGITVRGTRGISIRIADNGWTRGRVKALETTRRIAEAARLFVTIVTKQGTIVSIRNALRRPTGG